MTYQVSRQAYDLRLSERGILASIKTLGFHENVVTAKYFYQHTLGM